MNAPISIWRLRYECPALDNDGDVIEGEMHEVLRYYLSKSGLRKKLSYVERQEGYRVLSIDQGTIDWMAPDGHGGS